MCGAGSCLHRQHDAVQPKDLLYAVALTSTFLQVEQPINVIVQEKPGGTHDRLEV